MKSSLVFWPGCCWKYNFSIEWMNEWLYRKGYALKCVLTRSVLYSHVWQAFLHEETWGLKVEVLLLHSSPVPGLWTSAGVVREGEWTQQEVDVSQTCSRSVGFSSGMGYTHSMQGVQPQCPPDSDSDFLVGVQVDSALDRQRQSIGLVLNRGQTPAC